MTSADVLEEPPSGLFFAGSDDEDVDAPMEPPQSPSATASTRGSSPVTDLFLPGSDDEAAIPEFPMLLKRKILIPDEEDSIVLPFDIDAPSIHMSEDVPMKHLSPVPQSKDSTPKPDPPAKKRRLPPPRTTSAPGNFPPTYLGEVLVPNAWSNVSGRGYVACNDPIRIYRDNESENSNSGSSKTAAIKGKKGSGKKQMSLSAMLKPQPSKPNNKKKKEDTIVRLLSSRGTGRLILRPTPSRCMKMQSRIWASTQ